MSTPREPTVMDRSTDEVIVRVDNLHKHFGKLHVLRGISLQVRKGEVVVLIGPSGSGKSTFLRCLNRLEDPSAGHIFVGNLEITAKGVDVVHVRKGMGMVFQHFNLFPHMT